MTSNDPGIPPERGDARFDRMLRLVGRHGLDRLRKAHVMLIGCGGVGSWAAEALARAAVGRITLVDFDTVCITNFNRQLQALDGAVGKPKVEVLTARLRLINPEARVEGIARPFSEESHSELMADRPGFVIDAIDHITSKCFLINYCRSNGIPFVVSTGSGGRMDPAQVRVMDLGRTETDPLARAIRKILKGKYGFPRKGDFGVRAVCSLEQALKPHYEAAESAVEEAEAPGPDEAPPFLKKRAVLGTAGFVTGAFGLACAAEAVRHIISGETPSEPADVN